MSKKYYLEYTSGATGYGWGREFDRLDEFEDFINEMRNEYTAAVRVWDSELKTFIFWKRALSEPTTDMLSDMFRDMRTTTRKWKH